MRFCLIIFCIGVLFIVGSCAQVSFHQCGTGPNSVSTVLIDSCHNSGVTSERCVLYQDTRIKVNAVFIAPFSASDLEVVATANIMGKAIPLPESSNDPCQGHIIPGCPLRKGRMYMFKTSFDVLKVFPIGSTDVQYGIRDRRTKKFLGCVVIPVSIHKAEL